jgi:hypothetical protein
LRDLADERPILVRVTTANATAPERPGLQVAADDGAN